MVASLWGPAYRGLGGYFRKMGELAIAPNNYPFMIGAICSFALIAAVPVTEFSNRSEIMEEKKARTGSYH